MRRQIMMAAAAVLCMLVLFADRGKCMVYAKEQSTGNALSGNVELLKQEDDNYIMQVTVENRGEDFSGMVQVIFQADYGGGNCAYDTEIALPAQGKKQFTLTVTGRAADSLQGMGTLNFLDEKGRTVQSIPLKNVFGNTITGLTVGILSDDYPSLTYMDAGGTNLYVRRAEYPLNLVQLSAGNLKGYLDGLYFLVIDRFDVSSLAKEDIQAVQEWVKGGGWLMVGTGLYANETLSGFDEDFLDIEVLGVSEPGEENVASVNQERYGYYYYYMDADVDFKQMAISQLGYDLLETEESSVSPAIYKSIGEGSAAIYFYSLGDGQLQQMESYALETMYQELMNRSSSYSKYFGGSSNMDSMGQRLLAYLDSRNTNVDFSVLKWLIGAYVVLVGPILYLALRKCKKSEWYWVGVPALGLLFIAAVFALGRSARVNETRVYSVTAQQAGSGWEETYFLAYHSGVKPWDMRLEEGYEVAGPGWNGYSGYYSRSADEYFYRVINDSEGLSIGIKPRENFENGFLYAAGRTQAQGSITGAELKEAAGVSGGISGKVTNQTGRDLAYMAVWMDRELMVFEDVKAGETLDLQQADAEGRCLYQASEIDEVRDLVYGGLVSLYGYSGRVGYREDDMGALAIGLGIARDAMPRSGEYAIIAGVIADYDKAVADRCKETSYGCLYDFVETGV